MAKEILTFKEAGKLNLLGFTKEVFRQRRVWAAVLSAVAAVGAVFGLGVLVTITGAVAAACSLDSYVRPAVVKKPAKKKTKKSVKAKKK